MPLNHHDVAEAADAALCASGYTELKKIHCEYEDQSRVLTLHGRVSHYYFKQLSQEIVKTLGGVDSVVNKIRVES